MVVESEGQFAHRILRWFDAHARELPWRNPPGRPLPLGDPNWPYQVWLSEIMLQQTTVTAVKPYFEAFIARWPSVVALAGAADADVMAAWAGLGYYARARNLLGCAQAVVESYDGQFPSNEAELLTLPGIGAYTAAAIASIAFGNRAVVVDGNVERVIARVHAVGTPLPAAKPELRALAETLTPSARAGDYAQGMMDLGATICTPKSPACASCPVSDLCAGRTHATDFPVKAAKKSKPHRHGIAWWIERGDEVFLVRRDDKRMLGGMRALPSDDWDKRNGARDSGTVLGTASAVSEMERETVPESLPQDFIGHITHIFTHFSLTLEIRRVSKVSGTVLGTTEGASKAERETVPETFVSTPLPKTSCIPEPNGEWWPKARLDEAGLPSLFAKAARLALERNPNAPPPD